MGCYLAIGPIPAGLAGVTLRHPIESLFQQPILSAAMIFVTGELLWLTRPHSLAGAGHPIRLRDSFWIGIAQAVALLPGISRSGSTIATGLLREVDRAQAARFSFLLSVPVIFGAGLLRLPDITRVPEAYAVPLLAGFLTTVIFGYLALRLLLKIVHAGKLHYFAWYCWALSIAGVVWFWREALNAR